MERRNEDREEGRKEGKTEGKECDLDFGLEIISKVIQPCFKVTLGSS